MTTRFQTQQYILLIIIINLSFPLVNSQWTYISGNQTINTRSDYTTAYIGSLNYHTMELDRANRLLYVFGGQGYDDGSSTGILFVLVNR